MSNKKIDYLVVGSGLAGILFCELLKQHGKSFIVIDDQSQKSSVVAGGLYNPVVLKRFTPAWNAKKLLEVALPMYNHLEKQFKAKLDYKLPVLRVFASVEEQNNWFLAQDKSTLSEFMNPKIITNKNPSIKADFGLGEVLETGRVDTLTLIKEYRKKHRETKQFLEESFIYNDIVFKENNRMTYKYIDAKHIVFAEGFGLKNNPFFNHLPLNGTKGELILIKSPQLKLNFVLKSNVFIIPKQDDYYLVGATYEWTDKTNKVTKQAKNELIKKLKTIICCEFEVVKQYAGIRPTVKDRRPLVGTHNKYHNLHVLNGLGTRGVMIAPYVAHQLFNNIEHKTPLDSEIDIKRFYLSS